MRSLRAILTIGANYVRTQALIVVIMAVYLSGIAVVFFHNQRSQEARFFLQLHSFYIIFLAMMIAVPAIYGERKSRRIVAVLSKGIERWEYLAGILCGCGTISAFFCSLVAVITGMLGARGGYLLDGLGGLILVLFLSSLLVSAIGLMFGTFLHPLLATASATAVMALPLALKQLSWKVFDELFPVTWLADHVLRFEFGEPASSRGLATAVAGSVFLTVLFWLVAVLIFARRDVTTSPE